MTTLPSARSRKQASPYDVVVVGARVAGAATALLLARCGWRVTVLERSRYGSDTLSTHALMRAGVLQLSRFGVLDRIVAAGTPPIHRVRFRYPDREVTVPVTPSPGVDALYAPRRTLLDRVLVDAAVEAGATVRFGVTATDLCWDDDGRVAGIVARDRQGRHLSLPARFTVGADGIRSLVARRAGATIQRQGVGATRGIYGYFPWTDDDAYEWAYAPGGAAGVIPTNGATAVVFAATSPPGVHDGPARDLDGRFRRLLAEASPELAARLASVAPITGLRGFAHPPGYLRDAGGPGWMLVGDAGCWKDPLSAHGITDALRDAELAARSIDAALSGVADQDQALAAFRSQRDRLTVPLLDAVERLVTEQWDGSRAIELVRAMSASMAPEVAVLEALDTSGPPWAGTLGSSMARTG